MWLSQKGTCKWDIQGQRRRQKIFQGGRATEKDRKLAKNTENSTICLFQGGGQRKKKTEK